MPDPTPLPSLPPPDRQTPTCISCGYIATLIKRDFRTDEAAGIEVFCKDVEMRKCEKCGDVVITPEGHRYIDSRIALARHLKITDLQRDLSLASAKLEQMEKALKTIAEWRGHFPPTNRFWTDQLGRPTTEPMSYSSAFGSNGERDYMRGIATAALASSLNTEKKT